jgi:AcrR family transcriptional regulator
MTRRPDAPARSGLPDKRRSILAGALKLFARDGYTRASVDAIAAEAGVSTRTIYNHFDDKAQLFQAVIQASATAAADAQIAIIDRCLSRIADVEADLTEFGLALVAPMLESADHFALVRQIEAEQDHVPRAAIRAWRENGPLRVRRELGRKLVALAERGLLEIDDPERAALHLMLLVAAVDPSDVDEKDVPDWVGSGVRAFLHGYGR